MAMNAGIGASKLLILVGAGVGGSVILRNSRISDLLSDLSKVLSKHLKEEDETLRGDGGDSTAALTAQVRRLTMELRQLASQSRAITVVNGGSSSGGANLGALVVPVAVVGVAGYGYMWWKGWSFSDVMYVTRRNMSNAVASVSKQLENVSSALVATKRVLTARLDVMSRSLEDNMTVTHAIETQVGQVREDVQAVGLDMREVQKQIEGLEGKIDEVQGKQALMNPYTFAFKDNDSGYSCKLMCENLCYVAANLLLHCSLWDFVMENHNSKIATLMCLLKDFTNQGIYLLCRFVLQGLEGNGQKPELLQGFHAYSRVNMRLERSSSTPFSTSAGLKELQSFSDKLLMGTGINADSPVGNSTSSPNLQRSVTTNGLGGFIPRSYVRS